MLEVIEQQRGKQAATKVLIVWLHGLGATSNDFQFLVSDLHLNGNEEVKFIFPQAPNLKVTLNNGFLMPAWYDIVGLTADAPQDIEGANQSMLSIEEIIDRAVKSFDGPCKIFLGGFSQGGAMALYIGMRSKLKFNGIMCCSGYFLGSNTNEKQDRTSRKFFIAHGKEDEVVKLGWGFNAFKTVKEYGYEVTWREYEGLGHSVSNEEVNELSKFIISQLS